MLYEFSILLAAAALFGALVAAAVAIDALLRRAGLRRDPLSAASSAEDDFVRAINDFGVTRREADDA